MDQGKPPSDRLIDEKTNRRLVLIVLGVALAGSLIIQVFNAGGEFMPYLIAAEAGGVLLAWFGKSRLAGLLAPLAILVVLSVFVFMNSGIRNTAILGFPLVIVAGSLMNGRRGTVFFGILSLLIVAALGFAEFSGWVQWDPLLVNDIYDYMVVGVILAITVVIQWAVISRHQVITTRISQELSERQRAEEALRESETRYRTVVETFPDIIVLTNLHNKVLFVNDAFIQQTGYTWEDLTHPASDFIHPEDAPRVRQAVIDLLKSERICTDLLENRYIHKDGRVLWYSGIISKVQYQGEPCLQTITREITAQKAAESALRENEERFRLISSLTSDYTFQTGVDKDGNLMLRWASGAFEAITGFPFEEYNESGGWLAHLHPDDTEIDLAALKQLMNNQPVIHELRTIAKDQKIHWVRVYAHPVWNERENRLVEIVGAVQDITARKEAEERTLQANAELQRRILELSVLNAVAQAGAAAHSEDEILEIAVISLYDSLYPDLVGIWLWDEKDSVLRIHPRANRGTPPGIDPLTLAAQPSEGVVGWVLSNKQPYHVQNNQDARYSPLLAGGSSELCVPIMAGDRLVGVLDIESKEENAFTVSDEYLLITVAGQLASALERLRAEQALRTLNLELEKRVDERTALLEEAYKELEAFSYSVSHDLRAPLRRINGFANILVEDFSNEFSPEAQNYVEKIIGSGVKMANLIDGLLALSRLGRQALAREDVDLNLVVRSVIDTLRADSQNQNVDWVVTDLPTIYGDPVLVQQVFVNLLDNAIKYTSKRQHARIEVGRILQNGKPAVFVRDNGIGFDMEFAGSLFGVFQRLHPGDEFEGMGIGLAIVKRIVERHGGKVWAEAAPDQGATFYLSWE